MNYMVNGTSLTNFQFLAVCYYIKTFGIFFNNKDPIANYEQNQPESILNTLFKHLSKSNEFDEKFHFLQKTLQETRIYRRGKIQKIDEEFADEAYRCNISPALFSFYKNFAQFFNKIDKYVTAYKQTVLQHLSKKTVDNVCSFDNLSSKFTAQTISKIYDYISKFFIEIENLKRNSDEQWKKLRILKRFKRQTGRKGGSNDISKTEFRLQDESSLTTAGQLTDDSIATDIEALMNKENSNNNVGDYTENKASHIDDYNDILMDDSAGFRVHPTSLEDLDIKSHEDNGAEKKFNQAIRSLASSKFGDDLTIEDVLEVLRNVRENNDNVDDIINDDASNTDNEVEGWNGDFLYGNEVNDNLINDPSDFKNILTETEDIGINAIQKGNNNVNDDSDIAANVQKIGTTEHKSQSTMEDEHPYIRFAETSMDTTSKSPDTLEIFAKGEMDYNFGNTLRILRDLGLSALKQYKDNLKQFRIDLNNLAIEQADETYVHIQDMTLWFSETTDRPNIIKFLRDLEFKTFYFNDITLLRKINGVKPWEALKQSSFDSSDERFKIYYHVTINSLSGFANLTDDETFEDLYITFPDVKFVVLQVDFLENAKTLVMELARNERPGDYVIQRRKDFKILNSIEKGKTKRLKAIEEAADMISSNVPMHTFEAAVEILKRYILKLEDSETPVPTYNKLAEEYCRNLGTPSYYESWKIPEDELIKNVMFYTYFDDKIKHEKVTTQISGTVRRKYGKLYDVYKNSSTMKKAARLEDFLNLYSLIGNNFTIRNVNKKRLLISLCIFALRQFEEDFVETPITLNHFKYVKKDFANSFSTRTFTLYFEVFTSVLMDIDNLPRCSVETNYPFFITLKLQNKVGLVDLNHITGENDKKYMIAPGMKFEVNSLWSKNVKEKKVLVVNMRNDHTEERNIIDIINKLFELLNY